jgi:tripartite-type tricarboxylate transporter receptor subunit TctC
VPWGDGRGTGDVARLEGAMPDLLSGRVQLLFGTNTSVSAHVKEGKLRVRATT